MILGEHKEDEKDNVAVPAASAASPLVLCDIAVDEEKSQRRVWCYYNHSNFAVGDVAKLRFWLGIREVHWMPVRVSKKAGSFGGFGVAAAGNDAASASFTYVWHNQAGADRFLQPMIIPLTCNRITLEHSCGAGQVYAFLACESFG